MSKKLFFKRLEKEGKIEKTLVDFEDSYYYLDLVKHDKLTFKDVYEFLNYIDKRKKYDKKAKDNYENVYTKYINENDRNLPVGQFFYLTFGTNKNLSMWSIIDVLEHRRSKLLFK